MVMGILMVMMILMVLVMVILILMVMVILILMVMVILMMIVMVMVILMVMGGAAGCAEEVVANKFLAQGRNSSTPISCPITLEIARSRLISKSKGMFSLFFFDLFTSAAIFIIVFNIQKVCPHHESYGKSIK